MAAGPAGSFSQPAGGGPRTGPQVWPYPLFLVFEAELQRRAEVDRQSTVGH
jgi:hypothetical protein